MAKLLDRLYRENVISPSRRFEYLLSDQEARVPEGLAGANGIKMCEIIKPLEIQELMSQLFKRFKSVHPVFHTQTIPREIGHALKYYMGKAAGLSCHFGLTKRGRTNPEEQQSMEYALSSNRNQGDNPLTLNLSASNRALSMAGMSRSSILANA